METNQKMKPFKIFILCMLLLLGPAGCKDAQKPSPATLTTETDYFREAYRPQFHFSPEEKWMNDPNGLVYHDGIYHLFFQYYPGDIVWGPMHWGHAVSKDLVYWEHRPIALFPDENGYIFSGSAVVDEKNTSGFGTRDNPPLVAVFTYHNSDLEEAGRTDFQTQGIAYSLDNGQTWTKYNENPVIGNKEGIRDFRDPKVFWHKESGQWIMVLVAGDHARFYRSEDLKSWEYLSSFGKDAGAHGGVWECPDLFALKVNGDGAEKWVLLISINPGAPNGGSGTQYFVGDFDGNSFTTKQEETRWIDWGTDNYAGITYNNVPSGERIFIGWMSNWAYANATPTETWRSAMTLPRMLSLMQTGDTYTLASYPLAELGTVFKPGINRQLELGAGQQELIGFDHYNQSQLLFKTAGRNFRLAFTNAEGDTLKLELKGDDRRFTLDRSASGKTDFDPDFTKAPLNMPLDGLPEGMLSFHIMMDWSSLELFINEGQYAMTAQIFPNSHYTELHIENTGEEPLKVEDLEISRAETIWNYTPE
jgi:fructan beta-fructosidase